MVKNPPADAGSTRDAGSIPGRRRYPGEVNGNILQFSYLGNPMNREALQELEPTEHTFWNGVCHILSIQNLWCEYINE